MGHGLNVLCSHKDPVVFISWKIASLSENLWQSGSFVRNTVYSGFFVALLGLKKNIWPVKSLTSIVPPIWAGEGPCLPVMQPGVNSESEARSSNLMCRTICCVICARFKKQSSWSPMVTSFTLRQNAVFSSDF